MYYYFYNQFQRMFVWDWQAIPNYRPEILVKYRDITVLAVEIGSDITEKVSEVSAPKKKKAPLWGALTLFSAAYASIVWIM